MQGKDVNKDNQRGQCPKRKIPQTVTAGDTSDIT